MKAYIGLGSNLGDRLKNLEQAAAKLKEVSQSHYIRASSIFENPALMPSGAPLSWNIPFLNAVIEMEWTQSAQELLLFLKKIEADMGRQVTAAWAPRIIDLDILILGNLQINEPQLKIPHPEIYNRSFVLDPLKQLIPNYKIQGKTESILQRSRYLSSRSPQWMGIFNITPDSFSSDGTLNIKDFEKKLHLADEYYVSILDLGAESTRPGAQFISHKEEWGRLQPILELLKNFQENRIFSPQISLDTRHAKTAELALDYGIDYLNDVSGLADPEYLSVLQKSSCDYILMHSLSVPADKKFVLSESLDPVVEVKTWAEKKLQILNDNDISLDRIIFDPGIGFGKTTEQSLILLQRIEEFASLPVRILVGHSRKSFISQFNVSSSARPTPTAQERDWESVAISLQMALRGIDILRVHEPSLHIRAHHAFIATAPLILKS